jgi:hypothetical protein
VDIATILSLAAETSTRRNTIAVLAGWRPIVTIDFVRPSIAEPEAGRLGDDRDPPGGTVIEGRAHVVAKPAEDGGVA